ncbi:ATP-grasp domain-containing protein [Peribacillus tepidiphilus]|jgi:gamma-F420-2:alpha-L-glutamate ligase|uniref:ATP-grasp domain-containing protein n=1 Tax=Peribacillus tepidiphilus TaxID=2652445 RepID=UPI0035B54820
MIKGWIIYNKVDADHNQSFIHGFIEQASQMGIDLQFLLKENFTIGVWKGKLNILYKGKEPHFPHFAIVRNIDETFRIQLEQLGLRVFNSSTICRIANNKARTHQVLAAQNIPMIDTIFTHSYEFNPNCIPFEFPCIVKDAHGRSGKQVYKVHDQVQMEQVMKEMNGEVIIQRLATEGKDLRVFVVGKQIICAILRESNHDFRANISLGGSSRVYHLSEKEKELVHKIIACLEIDYAGIDFIFDENGNLLLNEIEDVVGSRSLFLNTDINIYEIVLHYILHTLSNSSFVYE